MSTNLVLIFFAIFCKLIEKDCKLRGNICWNLLFASFCPFDKLLPASAMPFGAPLLLAKLVALRRPRQTTTNQKSRDIEGAFEILQNDWGNWKRLCPVPL